MERKVMYFVVLCLSLGLVVQSMAKPKQKVVEPVMTASLYSDRSITVTTWDNDTIKFPYNGEKVHHKFKDKEGNEVIVVITAVVVQSRE